MPSLPTFCSMHSFRGQWPMHAIFFADEASATCFEAPGSQLTLRSLNFNFGNHKVHFFPLSSKLPASSVGAISMKQRKMFALIHKRNTLSIRSGHWIATNDEMSRQHSKGLNFVWDRTTVQKRQLKYFFL